MDAAIEHCTKGIGIWDWASNDQGCEPDVVFAAAGDIPTQEALAATVLLREEFPDLKIRFVNVVDLFKLQPSTEHPHGLSDKDFDSLFTTDKPIIFNFHGYPWLIHRLTYRRTNHKNLHVRGYKEKGNINTPMELAINNETDRFSLAIDAIDRVPKLQPIGAHAKEKFRNRQIALPPARIRAWHRRPGHYGVALAQSVNSERIPDERNNRDSRRVSTFSDRVDQRQYDPHARHGCGPGGKLRSSRNPHGDGARGLYACGSSSCASTRRTPVWPNRDRFVLSIGHASTLLYALLHLTEVRAVSKDYETLGEPSVPLDALKTFRQLDSRCPGHPEYRWTSGVETTTGPLGQGVATSVGMAIARQWLAARYNRPGFELFDSTSTRFAEMDA